MKGRWKAKVLLALTLAASGVVRAQDNPPPPAAAPVEEGERPLGEEEAMVLNFERADIRDVIHSLATALGLSYTIDPRIEGQVTLRTTGKIPREDEVIIRNAALARKIPIMTTVRAAQASANGIRSLQKNKVHVRSLQEYHAQKTA